MSERAVPLVAADAFLEWSLLQDRRYELVAGVPMAMAGAKRRHDQIVVNVLGALVNQVGGGACRPFTADTAVRIPAGNVRRPDAGLDCGAFDDDATAADAPYLVVEVLSPSTRDFDMFGKLDEYKSVSSLRHIVVIDPDVPQVFHWSRPVDAAWRHVLLEGLDAVVSLAEIGCTLALEALYSGLAFRPQPRLVQGEADPD